MDVRSILGGCNEFSQTGLENSLLTGIWEGCVCLWVCVCVCVFSLLLLINPGGKLGSSVLLHFIAEVFPSLDFPCFTYSSDKTGEQMGLGGETTSASCWVEELLKASDEHMNSFSFFSTRI